MVRFRRSKKKAPYKRRHKRKSKGVNRGIIQRMPKYAMFRSGPPTGFPDRLRCKLKYCDNLTLTSTTGSIGKYFFRANSINDPDLTGTGHQPLYHDTFSAIYDQYAVISSHIVITAINRSTTDAALMALVKEDDGTGTTTVQTLLEAGHARYKLLTPLSGSSSKVILKQNFSAKKFLAIDPFTSQTYKTNFGSNPSEDADWMLSLVAYNSATLTVDFEVTIIYDCLFTELQTPTQS